MAAKIIGIVFLIALFFFLEVYPRILNKRRVNGGYINNIAAGLGFENHENEKIVGYSSMFYVELDFIVPSSDHLTNNSRIHLSVNYKPLSVFKEQEYLVEELRKKYPQYRWVANSVRLNLKIRKDGPNSDEIKKSISELSSILKKENLQGILGIESDDYGNYWDGEMMK